ncbi:hypothetical protein BACIH_0963 [Bacillus amyloliquefaciens]|nr:hypothetical protein U471_09940 [Bacillus amyloliquefaciens CC178]QEY88696.1 hypothetical protein BACIT_0737 [Bacillus amyloliquefaciens]QEY92729.1 hypothetical protein BACIH_0963 [Bacillus amyloliquefaciens]
MRCSSNLHYNIKNGTESACRFFMFNRLQKREMTIRLLFARGA